MKKWLITAALVVLVVTVAALAARAYTGQMITREVDAWADALAQDPDLLGDHIQVRHLAYEPGLFRGELHYDITLGVPGGHPLLDTLRVMYPALRTANLPLQGVAQVNQGPLFGREHGLVLAELSRTIELDAALADFLPDGRTGDGIDLLAALYADGSVRGQFTAADYVGAWIGATGEPADLALTGMSGSFAWQPNQRLGTLAANLDTLNLHHGDLLLHLEQSYLDLEITQQNRNQWRNHNLVSIAHIDVQSPDDSLRVEQLSADTTIQHTDGLISHRVAIDVGASANEHLALQDGSLTLLLDNLNADAYLRLLEQLAEAASGVGFPPSQLRQVTTSLEALLADGPRIQIERLNLSLAQSDDVMMGLVAEYPPNALTDFTRPVDMMDEVSLRLNAIVQTSAIRQISAWRAEAEARGLLAERGLERTPEQVARMGANNYRMTMLSLQFMPLVTLSGGKAEAHLELRDGDIYQDDERIMPVTQILRLFGM